LLGTCDFLWFISDDPALPASTRQEVQNPANDVFLSVVSLWEIMINHALGKLPLPQPAKVYIPTQRELHNILPLNLEESSVKKLALLPAIHRDPFDRMLVCQTQDYDFRLASSDPIMRQYQ
jgi:PIN domain nuclease of toxin-antitoxin system